MKKISELLKETREKKDISLLKAEKETKIKISYLSAIEKGQFNKLPSKTYAQGFVKNYATYLGIPSSKATPLFRREYEEAKQKEEYVPTYKKTQDKFEKRRLINPKIVVTAFVFLVVIGYLLFQFSSVFLNPELEVSSPSEGEEVKGNVILVEGKTDPSATVTVNGDQAFVAIDGTFSKRVFGFEGEENVKVVSKNRFGNETTKEIKITIIEE